MSPRLSLMAKSGCFETERRAPAFARHFHSCWDSCSLGACAGMHHKIHRHKQLPPCRLAPAGQLPIQAAPVQRPAAPCASRRAGAAQSPAGRLPLLWWERGLAPAWRRTRRPAGRCVLGQCARPSADPAAAGCCRPPPWPADQERGGREHLTPLHPSATRHAPVARPREPRAAWPVYA